MGKHPNADALSISDVFGYPVIFRTGDFQPGDTVVYIPSDSIVPDTQEFFWLAPTGYTVGAVPVRHRRIRAKKLRGIYSQGILVKAQPGMVPGQIVDQILNVTKYEPPEENAPQARGHVEKGPDGWDFIKYTDIEPLRRYKSCLELGEDVVLTEKIHGQNARFCWDGERMWCGSRKEIKKEEPGINWWHVAEKLNLKERFANFPKTIFFGEIYGPGIQKLTYGIGEKDLVLFDTFDVASGVYNDWDKTVTLAQNVGLPTVPVLYCGPWLGEELWQLAEGNSTLAGHVREGFVVKPVKERWDRSIGRVILKLVGEGYNLIK